ncbi:MAG: D-alanyl-D-alanine carboxypeptidase/D-alanyl-D-alanine-endopeptidase [Thiomargarita sp.]|nr:D-alanyl-D-alanine carboxypeptidase/D-alanyl-D-alanine-endopeptidase [Thiomargarita sp.]
MKKFTFIYCLLFITHTVTAQTLSQKINEILRNSCLDSKQTSINITSIPNRKNLYAYNANTPLRPASVQKIITSAAALHYLTPEYRFKTTLLHTGQRKGNTIFGNLIIRGGGDPRLSTKILWHLISQLKASGITRITGKLIIDAHFLDKQEKAPIWSKKRSQRAYDAKLSALPLNFNSIHIHVQAGEKMGDPLNAWVDPAYLILKNNTNTTQKGKKSVSVNRNAQQIVIKGSLPLKAKEQHIYRNVTNPLDYLAQTFHSLLKQAGITITQSTQIRYTKTKGTQLYQHHSQTLSTIVKELNMYSNNMTAEQILKTIAAERIKKPGTHQAGLKLLKKFLTLKNNRINTKGIRLKDASGLSHSNRMTTRAITDLLATMYTRFDIGFDFISSLPIKKNRFLQGNARVKTGSLTKVSNIVGYLENKRGQIISFAIFLNNNSCGSKKADKIENSIINAIYNTP